MKKNERLGEREREIEIIEEKTDSYESRHDLW